MIKFARLASWLDKLLGLPIGCIDLKFASLKGKPFGDGAPPLERLVMLLNGEDAHDCNIRAKTEVEDGFGSFQGLFDAVLVEVIGTPYDE